MVRVLSTAGVPDDFKTPDMYGDLMVPTELTDEEASIRRAWERRLKRKKQEETEQKRKGVSLLASK